MHYAPVYRTIPAGHRLWDLVIKYDPINPVARSSEYGVCAIGTHGEISEAWTLPHIPVGRAVSGTDRLHPLDPSGRSISIFILKIYLRSCLDPILHLCNIHLQSLEIMRNLIQFSLWATLGVAATSDAVSGVLHKCFPNSHTNLSKVPPYSGCSEMHQPTLDIVIDRLAIPQLLLLGLQCRCPGRCDHPATRQRSLNNWSTTYRCLASR